MDGLHGVSFFVGTQGTMIWASLAMVRTLCVNPRFTRAHDPTVDLRYLQDG